MYTSDILIRPRPVRRYLTSNEAFFQDSDFSLLFQLKIMDKRIDKLNIFSKKRIKWTKNRISERKKRMNKRTPL